ncbi:serine/threonine-protein kinase [Streptomyces xanthophaeus]|uniref:hypothetical protein n=1 Tax=Streptomyces xanthophaeus TaxID=67385 RepID=UPI0037110CDD
MRPPAELDDVPWHTLTHAYGPAEDVPEQIRALYGDDEETADEAVHELYGNIHHQGTVYPASAPAVPFLAHAVLHAPGKRETLLMLLAVLADHEPDDSGSPHWTGSSVAAICAEVTRVLPGLLPCLADAERTVRRAALRTVASVAELLPPEACADVVERLEALYANDPGQAVRADAMVVLARFGREVVEEATGSPLSEVRLAAAVLTAERAGPPYAPRLVDVFAADGAEPDPGDDGFPWPGGSSQEAHLTDLLTRDPDAGLAVAAAWIEAGDLHTRGSWLAREIQETWRDREPEVLELLVSALPHLDGTPALARTLTTVAAWIGQLPEPGAGIRDALHARARTEGEGAAPALLALVRSRDPRALDLALHHPGTTALCAAARSFPEEGDLLVPAIRRELAAGATGHVAADLIGALDPLGAAARRARPEVIDCLRTGRAPHAAARRLGLDGAATPEITALLLKAVHSPDATLGREAAVAHHRLTGDAEPALRTFEGLLSGQGPAHWYLSGLTSLGTAAAPLLPFVEPLLTARDAWSRTAAAAAHHALTGSPDRAVPVLAELVSPSPVGLSALTALAAIGEAPEHLRPRLRALAFSPLRLLGDLPFDEDTHPDEQLRTLAWKLLLAPARGVSRGAPTPVPGGGRSGPGPHGRG